MIYDQTSVRSSLCLKTVSQLIFFLFKKIANVSCFRLVEPIFDKKLIFENHVWIVYKIKTYDKTMPALHYSKPLAPVLCTKADVLNYILNLEKRQRKLIEVNLTLRNRITID